MSTESQPEDGDKKPRRRHSLLDDSPEHMAEDIAQTIEDLKKKEQGQGSRDKKENEEE